MGKCGQHVATSAQLKQNVATPRPKVTSVLTRERIDMAFRLTSDGRSLLTVQSVRNDNSPGPLFESLRGATRLTVSSHHFQCKIEGLKSLSQ